MARAAFDFNHYLGVLADARGQKIPWTNEIGKESFPQYPVEILAFAQSFYKSNEYDPYADAVVNRAGFHEGIPEADVAKIAQTSDDVTLVRAVLSIVVRGERQTQGTWAALIEAGILYDLVLRLRNLTDRA